ncbi:hypothetical protein ACGFNF_16030 [Micromonospora sp. NPDC048868]|uniref:hypothetical protein n=1 Tax=Micromonospora sp. NPDC048868 TaxID=3364258 RepID=UPI00371D93F4
MDQAEGVPLGERTVIYQTCDVGEQRGAVECGRCYGDDPESVRLHGELDTYRLPGLALGGFRQHGEFRAPRLVSCDLDEIPAAVEEKLRAGDAELELARESGLAGGRIA